MIQMPRRSVTRFFIPLIDVLTLLFCIFLLMPLVKAPAESSEEGGPSSPDEEAQRLRQRVAQLEKDLADARERLRPENTQVLQQRLAVRVLEIDAATGRLYYNDPERTEVRNEADAAALIDRDRRALGGARELYYVILYPRDRFNPYPTRQQREQYDRWFKDVAHGPEMPGAPAGGGGKP
jgi:hypothetical protein